MSTQNEVPARRTTALLVEVARAVRRRAALASLVASGLFVCTAVWIARSEPVYRAQATLLLDTERSSGGVLGELAALTAPPAAAAEIAVLRSRSLAEAVVRAPSDDRPVHLRAPVESALGLQTLVDDTRRAPFRALLARLDLGERATGGLYAKVLAAAPGSPETLYVRFVAPDRVELARPGWFGGAGEAVTTAWRENEPVEGHGWSLLIERDEVALGGVFRVRRQDKSAAILRVQRGTRVVETQRNSGVLELSVSDSDPDRAAAVANALCEEYFEQNVARGRRRASETVEFIRSQLEAQEKALSEAETEVVELQRQYPDLIDRASSSKALVTTSSEFAVRELQLGLVERAVGEALELLDAGRTDALSRIGPELADPLSVGLVEQIAALELELAGVERPGAVDARPLILAQGQELAAKAAELELQIEALSHLLERLRAGDASGLSLLTQSPDAGVLADPLTLGLVAELARVDGDIERLAAAFTGAAPELVRARRGRGELAQRIAENLAARLDGLGQLLESRRELVARSDADFAGASDASQTRAREALADARRRAREHLATRLEAVQLERSELVRIGAEIHERLGALPQMERALADPLRRLETHKELTTFLLRSMQEAEISRASSIASAHYVDAAVAPDRRYAPRLGVGLLAGALFAAALAVGLVLALERLRATLRGTRELGAATGLPVLGTIPFFERRTKGTRVFLPMRDAPDGPLAEAYRSLRANLRFAVGDLTQLRTLAVTSCAPSEGKSTTNVDLALALASAGRRVLLVDGDLRRPAVHRYLELREGPGLAEVLTEGRPWRPLVQASGAPGLDVLVAGRHRGAAGELLSGARSLALLAELEGEYDMVVFDLPPALVVADVETFAHRLDALLLLYREDGLPRQAVEAAVRRLRQSGAKLVGAILNASRATASEDGGYYGNGYGSHYYTKDETRGPLPSAAPREEPTLKEVP